MFGLRKGRKSCKVISQKIVRANQKTESFLSCCAFMHLSEICMSFQALSRYINCLDAKLAYRLSISIFGNVKFLLFFLL